MKNKKMSLIWNINRNLSKIINDKKLLQNTHIIVASYSGRGNSKNSDSPYKVVKAKLEGMYFDDEKFCV
jgi:hypothetical protein